MGLPSTSLGITISFPAGKNKKPLAASVVQKPEAGQTVFNPMKRSDRRPSSFRENLDASVVIQ
jgi:hypothetical protein